MGAIIAVGLSFIGAALKGTPNEATATALGWIGGAIVGSVLGVEVARAYNEKNIE